MSSTEALQPDKDAVLYVLDASNSMRSSGAFSRVLAAVTKSIMLIQRYGDRHFNAGVVFFNTVNTDLRRSQFDDVSVPMKVSEPTVSDLQSLVQLANSEVVLTPDDTSSEETAFQSLREAFNNTGASLVNALQQAKLELACLPPSTFRRLVLITDNDHPEGLTTVQIVAHDLVYMNILLVPIFLETGEHAFDPLKFWAQLVYLPPSLSMASRNANLNVSVTPYKLSDIDLDLTSLVQSKAERKPTVFRGELVLGSLEIGMVAYKIFGRTSPRRAHYVSRQLTGNYVPVAATTVLRDKHTGELVDENDVDRKFVISSSEPVHAPVSDVEALHQLRDLSLDTKIVVNSFIPVDSLPPIQGAVGSSLLIIPSNFTLENSKTAFSSLRRSLIRKRCVGCVTLVPKSPKRPWLNGYLYAFDPSPSISDRQVALKPGTQSGMYFVEAPYADDLRHPDSQSQPVFEERDDGPLTGLVKTLVRKFRVEQGFNPAQFPNPVIAQSSNVFEAVALDSELPDTEPVDLTRPNYDKISRNATHLTAEIRSALSKIESSTALPDAKRAKPLQLQEFRAAYSIGRIDCFTVQELRWALRELHMATNGVKHELVDRLISRLSSA